VRLWRILPRRSLRSTARAALVANGDRPRRSLLTDELEFRLRHNSWAPAGALAIVIHVPVVIGLAGERSPAWLATAWQVSATLIGLGVAVVVFLLQAAASSSLSSDVTYRSLLRHSWLVWPAAMALAFILACAVITRFDGSGPPAPWANTWALAAFCVQVAAFGASFARTTQAVSPAGVRRVLQRSFVSSIREATWNTLLRKVMTNQLHDLSKEHVSYGTFLTRGTGLLPRRSGVVYDVDRRLPAELGFLGLGGAVTITAEPGRTVGPDDPLAKFDGVQGSALRTGGWIWRLFDRAVMIRRVSPPPSPTSVFEDILDVGRRALENGSQSNIRSALELVVTCLSELPSTYQQWGVPYTAANVGEFLGVATEDQIVRALAEFSDEVFRVRAPQPALMVVEVPAQIVQFGIDGDAPLLVVQATSLWRRQLLNADLVGDAELEHRIHEHANRLAAQQVGLRQHMLEDPDRPMPQRLLERERLRQLFVHQIEVLRLYLDAGATERFASAWSLWTEWGRNWHPEHDVDDLEVQLIGNASPSASIHRRLAAARELLDAKRSLEDARSLLMLSLGAWALDQLGRKALTTDAWKTLIPYLVGAAPDAPTAATMLRKTWSDDDLQRLESWQRNSWNGQSGWQPADMRLRARFWAVLLLIRTMPTEGEPPTIDLGPVARQLGDHVASDIATVKAEAPRWDEVIGDPRRIDIAEACVRASVERSEADARARLAEAPLDAARVASYSEKQQAAYLDGDYLRKLERDSGALEVQESAPAADTGPSWTLTKTLFVAAPHAEVLVDATQPARSLVVTQLEAAYAAYEAVAERVEGGDLTAAAAAIERLREAGHAPNAILVPNHAHLRGWFGSQRHPQWEWTSDFLKEHAYYARLAGVPVYPLGPASATSLIVCTIGETVRRVETRPHSANVVDVRVQDISLSRARELIDAGHWPPNVSPQDTDAAAEALRDEFVEVTVGIDVTWRLLPTPAPVIRVELPAADERRLTNA
jgi:hypothetical protein